jgi:hypothetical protein
MISAGTICSFWKLSAQTPMMKPNRLKVTAVSTRNSSITNGWAISNGTKSRAVARISRPEADRLGRRRPDIADHRLEPGDTGADSSS